MPSGAKKRKALKKPRPGEPPSSQGEPPELEPGSEESMAKDGEEMVKGGASEAMAEVGVEKGKEPIDEASGEGEEEEEEEEEDEVTELEEASAPDHPEVNPRDPPSQTELESEAPTISEARDEKEVDGETPISQGESRPQIEEEKDIPLRDPAPSEAFPREIKPEVEPDAEFTGLDRDKDGVGTPPVDIAPEADEDKPTGALQNEMDDTTPDDIAAVGVDPGVDEIPDAMESAVPGNTQSEKDEATVARELDTDAASANIEREGTDVAPVETAAETDDGPASVRSEVDEAVVETQRKTDAAAEIFEVDPEMGAAPADAQSEMDKYQIEGEVEADTHSANIEPEVNEDASPETAAETDKSPPDVQSATEEAADQRLDAVPCNLEPETAESELQKEAAQVGEDASTGEIDQEGEPVAPRIESQTDEGEIEASTDVTSVDAEPEPEMALREGEPETEASPGEFKPEVDATLDDTANNEVIEAEVNATQVDSEQDEGAQIVAKQESDERSSIDIEPEVELENAHTSLEAEADALKEIESEPERPGDASQEIEAVTGPTTQELEEIKEKVEPGIEGLTELSEVSGSREDLNEGAETPLEADTEPKEVTIHEVELVDNTEPVNEALTEASEISGSKEELNQEVETPLEADTEPDGETTSVYEPEAVAEVPEPEPEVEVPSESKPDQEGPSETESGQQDLVEVEPDQPNTQDHDQQTQQQERETDSGVEGPELPAGEANQEESSAVSATAEVGLDDGSAPSAPEGEASAIADTGVPANEQEMLEEGEVISSSGKVLKDETYAADTEVVLDSEEGAVNEQPDESKDYIIQREEVDVDDEKASSGKVHRSAVPSEQDSEIEQPPVITVVGEVALGEEPHSAVTEHSQPIVDKQDLTSIIDVPSGQSEMVEQGSSTTLPPESEVTVNECEPKDGVTFEQELKFDSASEDVERDIGEEETALSTVAEAGSAVNDFDESASYQQLPTDFPSSEQDTEISESRESDDTLSSRTPELIVVGLTEQIDGEDRELDDSSSPRAPELIGVGLAKQVGGEHADSCGEDSKVLLAAVGNSLKDEVEWKAVQDMEPTTDHEELSLESTKAENPATTTLESFIEVPVDICLSEESNAPDKELNIVDAGGGGDEDGQGTAPPTLGIVPALESLGVAEEELMAKVVPSDIDGLRSLPSSETTTHDLFTPADETGNQDNAVVNTAEPEIYTAEAKDTKTVAYAPSGEVIYTSNGTPPPPQSASPGQDIEDVQAFRQQKTQEASLQVVVPSQDVKQRALEQRNLSNEHPSRGGTLQRRTNWLGCCGMFDLLLGKNK